jgi:hypothetical protein
MGRKVGFVPYLPHFGRRRSSARRQFAHNDIASSIQLVNFRGSFHNPLPTTGVAFDRDMWRSAKILESANLLTDLHNGLLQAI